MKIHSVLTASVFFAFFSIAQAQQWVWVDSNGGRVFSDTPPPSSVPEKNIIKSPGVHTKTTPSSVLPQSQQENKEIPEAVTAKSPESEKAAEKKEQKNPDEKKNKEKEEQKKAAELERKKVEEMRLAQGRAENCQRAQRSRATLATGERVATINEKGERIIMEDATRNAEIQRANAIIARDCQ